MSLFAKILFVASQVVGMSELLSARGVRACLVLVVVLALITVVAAKKDKGPAVDIQAWYVGTFGEACLDG